MKENLNLKVADKKTREIVKDLYKNGFPALKFIAREKAMENMNQEQEEAFSSFLSLYKKEKDMDKDPIDCVRNDGIWILRNSIRDKLMDVLKEGMANLYIIRRNLVAYGAIPDPSNDCKYYYLPNFNMACWNCGDEIITKNQIVSICDNSFFSMSGRGKIRHKKIPFCPNCESVPPDYGIEKMDPFQEMAEDISPDLKH